MPIQGNSLFKLIYGEDKRGPLDVLIESLKEVSEGKQVKVCELGGRIEEQVGDYKR